MRLFVFVTWPVALAVAFTMIMVRGLVAVGILTWRLTKWLAVVTVAASILTWRGLRWCWNRIDEQL